jgi:hypothetical protein
MRRHAECMGQIRKTCKILGENPDGKIQFEDIGVDGRIILKCIS